MVEFYKKSLLAGILIGLGGFAFLAVAEPFVGAFVFAVGLIAVILLNARLYTGQVGYARKTSDIPWLVGTCLVNMLGAALVGFGTSPIVRHMAEEVATNKMNRPLINTFILAVICGALIYLAVEMYRKTRNVLTIIVPVFVFVASGAEHCIANTYYLAAGMVFKPEVFEYLLVCIVGNAVGSLIVSLLQGEKILKAVG